MEFVWVGEAAKKSKAYAATKDFACGVLERVWNPESTIECEIVDAETDLKPLPSHMRGR